MEEAEEAVTGAVEAAEGAEVAAAEGADMAEEDQRALVTAAALRAASVQLALILQVLHHPPNLSRSSRLSHPTFKTTSRCSTSSLMVPVASSFSIPTIYWAACNASPMIKISITCWATNLPFP